MPLVYLEIRNSTEAAREIRGTATPREVAKSVPPGEQKYEISRRLADSMVLKSNVRQQRRLHPDLTEIDMKPTGRWLFSLIRRIA